MRKFVLITLLFALVHSAHAQTFTTVAGEGDTVTNTSDSAITYRYGAPAGTTPALAGSMACATDGGCWDPSGTLQPGRTIVVNTTTMGGDPIYGTLKVLQIEQSATAQSVTVTPAAGGPSTTVPVPALPPPPPPTSIATPPGQNYAVTLSPIQTPAPVSPTQFGIAELPASGANVAYQSTQFNLTIGGVSLTCTYASRSGAIYTLNCAVPPASSAPQNTAGSSPQISPAEAAQIPVDPTAK